MADTIPDIRTRLTALKAANRALIRGTIAEKRAREAYQAKLKELRAAEKHLKLMLDAMQPPLFSEDGITPDKEA